MKQRIGGIGGRSCLLFPALMMLAAGLWAQTPKTQPAVSESPNRVIEGLYTRTASSIKECRIYACDSSVELSGFNKASLWFRAGSLFWRYDVKTRKIDAITSQQRFAEINKPERYRLAPNGEFFIYCKRICYLWRPGVGWKAVATPQGPTSRGEFIARYDNRSRLWLLIRRGRLDTEVKVFRLEGNDWKYIKTLDRFPVNLEALGDGWLGKYASSDGWQWRRLDADFNEVGKIDPIITSRFHYMLPVGVYPQFVQLRARAGITRTRLENGKYARKYNIPMFRINADGSAKAVENKGFLLWDVASGDAKPVTVKPQEGKIVLPALGDREARTISRPYNFGHWGQLLMQDANGDIWCGLNRFSNGKWEEVKPDDLVIYTRRMMSGLTNGALEYRPKTKCWLNHASNIRDIVYTYDWRKNTGWFIRNPDGKTLEWIRCRMGSNGGKLEEIKIPRIKKHWPNPYFEYPQGQFWFGVTSRWDAKAQKLHQYPDMAERFGMATAMLVSPSGTVWAVLGDKVARFDPKADKFVESTLDAVRNDFAFTCAGRRFSAVATPSLEMGGPDLRPIPVCEPLYELKDHVWTPVTAPFAVKHERDERGFRRPGINAFRLAPGVGVRKDRMLLTTRQGVFEYDLKNDRWAFLAPGRGVGRYEPNGRIVVYSPTLSGLVVFQGDVFATLSPAGNLEGRFFKILDEMEGKTWAGRNRGSNAMGNFAVQYPTMFKKYCGSLKKDDLSEEGRLRLDNIIDVMAKRPEGRLLGNSLYDRMRRPIIPEIPGGCALRKGASWEKAMMVLQLAGATRKQSDENGVMAFLLPNNTAAYLKFEVKDEEPTRLEKITLGDFGKGLSDPWETLPGKAVEKLELTPYLND